MLYVPLCRHTTFVQLTPALTVTIIDKITDVNKTRASVTLSAINILLLCHKRRYVRLSFLNK